MKAWIYIIGVFIILSSCTDEILHEEIIEKTPPVTRVATSEMQCRVVSGISGSSILSSKGIFTIECNWNFNDIKEASNLLLIEVYLVDMNTEREFYINDAFRGSGGSRSGNESLSVEIKRPGFFGIKMVATFKGRFYNYTKESTLDYISVLFPSTLEVISQFKGLMDTYWNLTKRSRKEFGFYIYLVGNQKMEYGEIFESEPLDNQMEIKLNMPFSESSLHCDPREGGRFAVAQFHTHPPMSHVNSHYQRVPGPSYIDKDNLPGNIPCLVYDYNSAYLPNNVLTGGHDLNLPGKIYSYNGNTRPHN